MGRAMRKVSAHLSFNRQFPQKQKFFKRTSAIYVCALGTGIKGSDLSQVYILISIFIFSVCVYECAGLHTLRRLRTTLRSHFPPDALWDPGTKLRLTGLRAGTGTQASHLASPQAEFFFQDLIVFTCFQIIFMSNVAVYNLPRPF